MYWARLAVPRPLRKRAGRDELVASLGTDSPSVAAVLARPVLSGWQAWIDAVGRGDLSVPPEVYVQRAKIAAGIITTGVLPDAALTPGLILQRAQASAQERAAGTVRPVDAWEQTSSDVERWAKMHPNPAEADLAVLRQAHKVALGDAGPLLADEVETYLAERKRDLTNQTWLETQKNLARFVKWAGPGCEVADVDRRRAGRFVAEVIAPRDVSAATRAKDVGSVRVFYAWAMVRGLVEQNPFALQGTTIKASKRGKEAARRYWTPPELLTILSGFETEKRERNLWPLTVLALYTGMRLNEVCNLRTEDFDAAAGLLHVREGKSGAAVREVPVSAIIADLVAHLAQVTPDGFLLPGLKPGGADMKRGHTIGKTWGRRIRKFGITSPQLDFHALRGTWIAAAMNGGASKEVTQQVAGHEREGVTMGNYARVLSPELCRQAVAGVTFGNVDGYVRKVVATESWLPERMANARR